MWVKSSLLIALCLLLSACGSPQQRAQKLFEQGQYDKVAQRYPRLPIARQAREKLAERLIVAERYDEVIKDYADLPAAWDARESKGLQALITYCDRVEIHSLDSATVTVDIFADPSIKPQTMKRELHEFMTSAAIRVGQWSQKIGKDISGAVRFWVDGNGLSLQPYQCRTAAQIGRDDPSLAIDYVMETADRSGPGQF